MTVQTAHNARKELLLAQDRLIAMHKAASRHYPDNTAEIVRATTQQAHMHLVPVATSLGLTFSEKFTERWETAIAPSRSSNKKRART